MPGLTVAADHFNVARLRQTCAELVVDARERGEPVEEAMALKVLKLLRTQRQVTLVQDVAEVLLAHGVDTPDVRHAYAVALLDENRTAAAESILGTLRDRARAGPEVAGAIGRVHKQRYLTCGPASGSQREVDLAKSVEAYGDAFRDNPTANDYHGANAAALLVRAARDGVALPTHPKPRSEAAEIALAILASITRLSAPAQWQLATAAEACLVLDRPDEAFEWTAKYVRSEADAFQCSSTLRQFQVLWRLDTGSEPGLRLLPLLRNRLLRAAGGEIRVNPSECAPEALQRFDRVERLLKSQAGTEYETVYGWDRFQSVQWLRKALDICRSVARIEDDLGTACGTGFVLDGAELRAGWPRRVLMTNAHVVPEVLDPEEAWITFRGLATDGPAAQARVQAVGEPLFLSPKHEFDACVLALPDSLDEQVGALVTSRRFPALDTAARPRAYVIGHPQASADLQVSLHDSRLLAFDDRFAHYRSPTERGSSGSPVFDDKWQLIALHHAAVPNFPGSAEGANEGIRLDRLTQELRSKE